MNKITIMKKLTNNGRYAFILADGSRRRALAEAHLHNIVYSSLKQVHPYDGHGDKARYRRWLDNRADSLVLTLKRVNKVTIG